MADSTVTDPKQDELLPSKTAGLSEGSTVLNTDSSSYTTAGLVTPSLSVSKTDSKTDSPLENPTSSETSSQSENLTYTSNEISTEQPPVNPNEVPEVELENVSQGRSLYTYISSGFRSLPWKLLLYTVPFYILTGILIGVFHAVDHGALLYFTIVVVLGVTVILVVICWYRMVAQILTDYRIVHNTQPPRVDDNFARNSETEKTSYSEMKHENLTYEEAVPPSPTDQDTTRTPLQSATDVEPDTTDALSTPKEPEADVAPTNETVRQRHKSTEGGI